MERVQIEALPRVKESKGSNKALRRKGYVPAVVYGRGADPVLLSLDGTFMRKVLNTSAGANVLLDLQVKGESGASRETVMIKELQRHPVQKELFLHADLIRISLDEKLEVTVPLNFIGEPQGVRDGGVFQIQLREIKVNCLPGDIPQYIDVSVEEMKVGDVLTVAGLKLSAGVEMLEEADDTIASVTTAQAIEEPEITETEGEEIGETGKTPEPEEKAE